MEDIRRMENETQEELETVRLHSVEILWFPFSIHPCLISLDVKLGKVLLSHFLLSVSLLNSGFLDTDILLFWFLFCWASLCK